MSVVVKFAEGEVEMAAAAPLCVGCGGAKQEGHALCGSCLNALPLWLRGWVTREPRDAGFADGLCRAVQHLVDVRATRNRWPYRSQDEVERAGFRIASHGQCGSVRCLRSLVWLWTPRGGRIPVDPQTYAPHAVVCLDPVGVVLRRIRQLLQTPARRRRHA